VEEVDKMGGVNIPSSIVRIMLFCVIFNVLFAFFAFYWTGLASGTLAPPTLPGAIIPEDIGIAYEWISHDNHTIIWDTYEEYDLNGTIYRVHWVNATQYFWVEIRIWKLWLWETWSTMYPEPYNDAKITYSEIISAWDNASEYSEFKCRVSQTDDALRPEWTVYVFFTDLWNSPANITKCLTVDGQVHVTVEHFHSWSQAGIENFPSWYWNMITMQNTYGLTAIPFIGSIVYIFFYILSIMGIISFVLLLSFLLKGWI
jgi:hypothetical protein